MNGVEEWPDDHPGAIVMTVIGVLFFFTVATWLWVEFLEWWLAR